MTFLSLRKWSGALGSDAVIEDPVQNRVPWPLFGRALVVIHLSLRKWSGQLGSPAIVAKIRRTIAAYINQDECVLVLDDGAVGLSPEVRAELERGDWPSGKVRFSKTHPELSGSWRKQARKKRRSRS